MQYEYAIPPGELFLNAAIAKVVQAVGGFLGCKTRRLPPRRVRSGRWPGGGRFGLALVRLDGVLGAFEGVTAIRAFFGADRALALTSAVALVWRQQNKI